MTKGGADHFVEFDDHTLLKHLILDRYLKQWAQKLLHWGGAGPQVWFVDAFAGEGGDRRGNPGSPVIASRIAASILRARGPSPGGRAPMQVVALEKNPGRHARLVEAMRPFSEHVPRIAHVRCTTLHDRVDALMKHVRQRPVLFFLDPFGVDGLVVKDLPKLLSGPQNEVFSLFSDTGAHRLYATLRTQDRNVAFEVAKVEEQPFLFADLTAAEVQTVREQSERRNAALRATQAGALRILEAALSAERLDALRSVPDDEVPYRATELWMDSLVAAGARYVFSIPVRDSRNQHVYRLVYATKSAAGSEAMKHALQAALNSSTLPTEVREGIRRELMMNAGDVVRELEGRFQGQRVGWIEKVRPYLLTETPLLPDQITLIRRELERRDYTFSRKPFAFSFPPTRPPVPRSRDTDSTPAP